MFRRPPTPLILQKDDVEELKAEREKLRESREAEGKQAKTTTSPQDQVAASASASGSGSNPNQPVQHQADVNQLQRNAMTRDQRLGL